MTNAQREDLEIEWSVTSTRTKERIQSEYRSLYGTDTSRDHWERYLVEALNLKHVWQGNGLL